VAAEGLGGATQGIGDGDAVASGVIDRVWVRVEFVGGQVQVVHCLGAGVALFVQLVEDRPHFGGDRLGVGGTGVGCACSGGMGLCIVGVLSVAVAHGSRRRAGGVARGGDQLSLCRPDMKPILSSARRVQGGL